MVLWFTLLSWQGNIVERKKPLLMGYTLSPTLPEAGEQSLVYGVRQPLNMPKPSVLHAMLRSELITNVIRKSPCDQIAMTSIYCSYTTQIKKVLISNVKNCKIFHANNCIVTCGSLFLSGFCTCVSKTNAM
jgi:hypothetical protein